MASKAIKGLTVEIGGDTTKLSAALRDLNKDLRSTQTGLKDINRLLKLDPKNTELLAQKQRALTDAVEGTKKKLDVLKQAADQARKKLEIGEISQKEYDELTRSVINTEGALKDLEGQARDIGKALKNEAPGLAAFGDAADGLAKKAKGISISAGAAATAMLGLAKKAGVAADDLNTLANQSGFSTEQIQMWEYAADRIDVDADTIIAAARRMKRNMGSTSQETQAAFVQLGVAVRDSSGQFRDATTVFDETVTALSEVPSETERDILAMQIFGKSADDLAGIIDDGGQALREFGEEAKESGLILSQDALDGANQFNDAVDELKAKAKQAFFESGAALAENLIPEIEKLVDVVGDVLSWFSQLDGGTMKVIFSILGLTAIISPALTMISKLAIIASTAATAFNITHLKVIAVVGALALIVGAVAAVSQAWDHMSGFDKFAAGLGVAAAAAAALAVATGALAGPGGALAAAAGIAAGIGLAVAAVHNANSHARAESLKSGMDVYGARGGAVGNYEAAHGGQYQQGPQMAPAASNRPIILQMDGATMARGMAPYLAGEGQRQGVKIGG